MKLLLSTELLSPSFFKESQRTGNGTSKDNITMQLMRLSSTMPRRRHTLFLLPVLSLASQTSHVEHALVLLGQELLLLMLLRKELSWRCWSLKFSVALSGYMVSLSPSLFLVRLLEEMSSEKLFVNKSIFCFQYFILLGFWGFGVLGGINISYRFW